jgi:hypothetical protein
MEIQAQIPAALCALHNYICLHDPSEGHLPADDEDEGVEDGGLGADMAAEDDAAAIEEDNEEEFCQGSVMRDRIAAAMCMQYQCVVQERGLDTLDIMDDDKDAAADATDDTDGDV